MAATEIEGLVVDQIRAIGNDRTVFEATLAAAHARADGARIATEDLRLALSLWDDLWAALTPKEQARVLALLVDRVAYDGAAGTAVVTFRPSGIRALAEEVAR